MKMYKLWHAIYRLIPELVRKLIKFLLYKSGIEVRLVSSISERTPSNNVTPRWVTVQAGPLRGAQLYLNVTNKAYHKELIEGSYDSFIYEALEEIAFDMNGATCWDVGAYIGYHTLALANLVGSSGKVIAFEPNIYNLERLRLNIKKNTWLANRISVHEIALSNSDGRHYMQVSSEIDTSTSSGSYLDYGHRPSDRYSERVYINFKKVEVQVAKPDTLIKAKQCDNPNFIKVDIEGAEVDFLYGADFILTQLKPVLIIEVHNIRSMFYIREIFFTKNYHLRLLHDGSNSSSRCFILAQPTSD